MPMLSITLSALAVLLQTPAYAPQLDAFFEDVVKKGRCPSVTVAVVRQGKVEYAKGYGLADLENEVPATPETVYRLGSITKQFTATMIMQLVAEGKLNLDDPFEKSLAGMPHAWSAVTIRQLLNHTSGIKSYTEVKGLFEDQVYKPTNPSGIIKTVAKDPLDFPSGTKWHYNNSGYELLGMLIEKADGRPYEASLNARILKPLGMSQTYFTSESTVVKHRAQGYSPANGGFKHTSYLNMDWPFAAGSMESTVLDLAKWDAALYGEAVLPQASLKQMWTPTKLTGGKVEKYGFGWALETVNDTAIVQHGGGINGFTTNIRRAPSKQITVIVLTNSDASNPDAYAKAALGMAEPSLKVAESKTTVDTDAKTDAFAKSMLQAALDGTIDRSKLTPAFSKILTPELASQAKEQLGKLGVINEFKLVDTKEVDGKKVRSYQIVLGTTALKMVIIFDAAGLVGGFGVTMRD